MKRFSIATILALVLSIAAPITATTTICPTCATTEPITLNVGPSGYGCGQLTGAYKCTGIPIAQGTEYASLNLTTFYNGAYGNVQFGDGLDNLGLAYVTSVDSSKAGVLVINFAGPDPDYIPDPTQPSPNYTGTLTLTYRTYKGYRSGRGATWFTAWSVTGGTVSIRY